MEGMAKQPEVSLRRAAASSSRGGVPRNPGGGRCLSTERVDGISNIVPRWMLIITSRPIKLVWSRLDPWREAPASSGSDDKGGPW